MVKSEAVTAPLSAGIGEVGDAHRTLHEVVAERIRTAILNGTLYPGERLVEDRLAQEMDVSRHPVREALRTLQLEGFVEISPRRGATVSRVSTEEAGELFEVLSALDGLAAGLAAAARSESTIDAIEGVLDRADVVLEFGSSDLSADSFRTLAALNRDFHVHIAQASGNQQLIETLNLLRDRIQWIQAAVNRRRPELSWPEHRKILDAILAEDSPTAEALAREHIEAARLVYLSQRANGPTSRL
jgi:DNA-binding GntR family transcriptional regulator